MRLGSEPAAESSRMARFADWFVASPVSAEYGITGLTVRRLDHNFAPMVYFGAMFLRFVVDPSPRFRFTFGPTCRKELCSLPFPPYRN